MYYLQLQHFVGIKDDTYPGGLLTYWDHNRNFPPTEDNIAGLTRLRDLCDRSQCTAVLGAQFEF